MNNGVNHSAEILSTVVRGLVCHKGRIVERLGDATKEIGVLLDKQVPDAFFEEFDEIRQFCRECKRSPDRISENEASEIAGRIMDLEMDLCNHFYGEELQ